MEDALARFDTARAGDHTVLTVHGELDLSNVDALDRHIENAGRRGGLALDLSGVAYLDSSALRTIFRPRDFRVVLVAPEDSAADRLIALAALQSVLPRVASVPEAVSGLEEQSGSA